jgi:hypothetical protein
MRQNESLIAWFPLNNDTLDVTRNGYDGTGTDLIAIADRLGRVYHAYSFNGTTSQIACANFDIEDDVSMSYGAWVRLHDTWSADGLVFGNSSANSVSVLSNQKVRVSQSTVTLDSETVLDLNTWYHIIYTFEWDSVASQAIYTIYINGVQDSYYIDTSLDTFTAATQYIGVDFNGDIDDVRVYNAALGTVEAALVYNGIYSSEKRIGDNYQFRCIVEHSGTLYYPAMVSASTNINFPWAAQTANIAVITNPNLGTDNYMSPIREGDPIRLQVSIRTSTDQDLVWQTLFEGRIFQLSGELSATSNNTTISARGYDEELLYTMITSDESYSNQSSGDIIDDIFSTYMTRISGSDYIDTHKCSDIIAYNVDANTKYVADIIRDLEQLELYNYRFSVRAFYDASGFLSSVEPVWQPISEIVNYGSSVTQGNRRFISANFSTDSSKIVNNCKVVGSGVSALATTGDADRYKLIVDNTLTSASACAAFAEAYIDNWAESVESGSVRLTGDANVEPGMLIQCTIPSLILNGTSIDGEYVVNRVTHSISNNSWITTLNVGQIRYTSAEMIANMNNATRLTSINTI